MTEVMPAFPALPGNQNNSGAILVRLGYTYPNLASWALAFFNCRPHLSDRP